MKIIPVSEVKLMDCMEGMKAYPDNYFELAIVDPPYGINVAKMAYTQEDNRPCKQKNGQTLTVKKLKYKHGTWDKAPPPDEYFSELFRVSKNQLIWGENYLPPKFRGGRIVWNKLVPEGVSFSDCEIAFCSFHERVRYVEYMWAGMMQGEGFANPKVQKGDKSKNEKRIHPTQKPIALYKWLLSKYAKQGDKILDTHLGSGSSRIAAYLMGFDFYGFEIDPDYFAAQEKRFKEQTAQQSLFNYKEAS
jgi:site-specific DNA-methyltransferase (adenine-specific)